MKKKSTLIFALCVVTLASSVALSAGPAPDMKVSIPFAFYAGRQAMPAGEYRIEMAGRNGAAATGSMVAIRSQDGSVCHLLLAATVGSRENSASRLTFTRYGTTYFLSRVQSGIVESSLPVTRAEREYLLTYTKGSGKGDSGEVVLTSSGQE